MEEWFVRWEQKFGALERDSDLLKEKLALMEEAF